MSILDIDFPDFSGHPPPPKLSFEEYQHWICELAEQQVIPRAPRTFEELRDEFLRNEGSQKEPWPDFTL